ncbi:MAG TPA: hypothetical protein VK504_13760 [Vicinamibacterales bacterium]|nr:hypothetical protein [Vicinamibacterales bacterium]
MTAREMVVRLVLIVIVLAVPTLAALNALDMQEQSMLDAPLRAPVYAVSEPVVSTVATSNPQRDTPTSVVPAPNPVDDFATVDALPVRGVAYQVAATVPPPAPVGLHGLPLAPAGLTACETASFYRAQAGLPAIFDTLAFRESRCQPDASNWCCSGIWQIHKLWVPRLADCGVYVRADLYDAQRNACAAAYVYAVQGIDAWSTA